MTCGGLCPGLNDVIRSVVMTLWYEYGVRKISGIRYGYLGLIESSGLEPMELTPDKVSDIHRKGGTILGSSRGNGERIKEITDTTINDDGYYDVKYISTLFNQIFKKKSISVSRIYIKKTSSIDRYPPIMFTIIKTEFARKPDKLGKGELLSFMEMVESYRPFR